MPGPERTIGRLNSHRPKCFSSRKIMDDSTERDSAKFRYSFAPNPFASFAPDRIIGLGLIA